MIFDYPRGMTVVTVALEAYSCQGLRAFTVG